MIPFRAVGLYGKPRKGQFGLYLSLETILDLPGDCKPAKLSGRQRSSLVFLAFPADKTNDQIEYSGAFGMKTLTRRAET